MLLIPQCLTFLLLIGRIFINAYLTLLMQRLCLFMLGRRAGACASESRLKTRSSVPSLSINLIFV